MILVELRSMERGHLFWSKCGRVKHVSNTDTCLTISYWVSNLKIIVMQERTALIQLLTERK